MPVFVDRSKLSPSYIPAKLLHREGEKQLLTNMLLSGIDRSDDSFFSKVRVVGGVGVGKTTLCIKVGQELEKLRKHVRYLYVNLRRFSTSKVGVYRYLVKALAPEAFSPSLSAEELLENLLKRLRDVGEKLVVTFDDADYHVSAGKGRETIVYDFTRLHEVSEVRPLNIVGVVFVFRDDSVKDLLERPEQSSLGTHVVKLAPYNKQQVIDILKERVDEAFRRGAVPHTVIEYVAETTSRPPFNGDVRFALDLLLYAGNLAESRGFDAIKIDDVRHALAESASEISGAEIGNMPEKIKVALLSVAKTLLISDEPSEEINTVKKTYEILCEQRGLPSSGFDDALKHLSLVGYVKVTRDGKVELLGVDAGRLVEFLESSLKRESR